MALHWGGRGPGHLVRGRGGLARVAVQLAAYKNANLSGTTTITRSAAAASDMCGLFNTFRGTGKYWFEYRCTNFGTSGTAVSITAGVCNSAQSIANGAWLGNGNFGIGHNGDGRVVSAGGIALAANATTALALNEWGMCAVDLDNGLFWVSAGGRNWNNSGTANPATGVGGIACPSGWFGSGPWFPAISLGYPNSVAEVNFAGTPNSRTAPAGFSAWPGRIPGYRSWYMFNVTQVIPNNAQWANACEIELRNASGTDLTSPAGTNAGQMIYASSYNGGAPVWSPDKAFNNDSILNAGWMASGLVSQQLYYYDGDDRDLSAMQTLFYAPRPDIYDGYWQAFTLSYADPDVSSFWVTQKSYSGLNLNQGQTATLAAY